MILGTPWMLLLLPLLAATGWLMALARRWQLDAARRLNGIDPENRPSGLGRRDWFALAALACIVLALARPQWNPRPHDVERRGRDLVFALDVSRSMLAADVYPSRLEAARIAIHEALPALAGQRLGLITFAGSATVRVPLTLDHGFVRYMLERVDPADMAMGSTSLQAAFDKALGTVLTDSKGGRRDLIVLTDGEDHLSDLDKTEAMLAKSGANVLIVGLGDPVQGARVPDPSGNKQWMKYRETDVVSRLDESVLAKLAGKSSHASYYPARTRPFDLIRLYQELISRSAGDAVVGSLREVRYTEGYPFLLGLSAALWLAASPWRLPARLALLLVVLVMPACSRPIDDKGPAVFQARVKRGEELLKDSQQQAIGDHAAVRALLMDAREEFLRAEMLRPGDIKTARQISAITRRVHEVDAALANEREQEAKRREKLSEAIARLESLTERQARLAQQSSQLLRRRLVSRTTDLSESRDSDNEMTDDKTADSGNTSDAGLAEPAVTEQQSVREGTTSVLETVSLQQNTLRKLLERAYGNPAQPPPTELDPAAKLLNEAVSAQREASACLAPDSIRWPQANTAFHTAAGRMQQALETLRHLQPPSPDPKDKAMPSRNDSDYNEDLDRNGADTKDKKPKPTSAGNFESELSSRSLPVPNYTPEEILAEEAANQQKRARQKAARAGVRVEKNW